MGFFNVMALTAETAVLSWYTITPLVHGKYRFFQEDFRSVLHFKQSLAAMALLSVVRLLFFTYIRQWNKRRPATRLFVFFVFLGEMIMCTASSLQLVVFTRDPQSFRRYRALTWGPTFVYMLWALSLFSTLLQLGYILQLNKSRGRLTDDKLIRDVMGEAATQDVDVKLAIWRTKWSQLVKQFKKKQTDPTFEAIVRLYAHRDGAVERLAVAYERDPQEFEFYIPQLCSFLLLGAFVQSPQLCIILLEKCSISHVFAHRMLWYLHSYCSWNPAFATEENNKRVQMLIEEVADRGAHPARAIANAPAVDDSNSDDKDWITRDHDAMVPTNSHEIKPLSPSQHDRYNTFPQQVPDLERGLTSADPFELETTFLTSLANLSSNLRSIALSRRNEMLRVWLRDLEAQYLPSSSIYLPVGNPYHRLKHIHVNESFTFSTRERVPFLLCAEVVSYPSPLEKKVRRKRSLFKGRRFTLNLWDTPSQQDLLANSAERAPLMSPDAPKLGFWSESKPSHSPRLRSFSQHISSSFQQPSELLHGIIDTFVRKTPGGKQNGAVVDVSSKVPTQESLLGGEEDRASYKTTSPTSKSQLLDRSESHPVPSINPLKTTLTIDTSGAGLIPRNTATVNLEFPEATHPRGPEDIWSPKSDVGLSPLGSPYSPPGLARFDSTDRFLLDLTERDSKLMVDDEDNSVPSLVARRFEPPCVIFTERWAEKERRIQSTSQFGHLPGWKLLPVIVKSNDDLRQEQLASQLIKQFSKVFEEAKIPVFVRPYDIIAISSTSGLVEAIADTISIDSLKRNDREFTTLLDFFTRHFGDPSTSEFRTARSNFVSSMAAYSIICYLLQVKDRHNGNILLDAEGHIIHIDFGFILSNNPGNMAFEQAPFKLTHDFVELMGGPRSASFRRFRSLCVRSFLVARKYRHRFILLVEMMLNGNEHLPCFAGDPKGTVERLAARFQPELDINSCEDFVHELIDASLDNWRTKWYDKYQRWCVGVF